MPPAPPSAPAPVIIAVDPHKASWTAVAVDNRLQPLAAIRVEVNRDGYRQLRRFASRWSHASWAIEGTTSLGATLTAKLATDHIDVVDVPAKLARRVRMLSTGHGRKTDQAPGRCPRGCPRRRGWRAAREVWERDARSGRRQHGGTRAHGGTPNLRGIAPDGPAALPPGGRAPVDGFDAAVRQEAMKLAEYVRPEALDESQRQWRATGKLPAGEPVQLLRDLAAEMNQAVRAGDAEGRPVEAIRLAQSHVEEALARDLQGRAAAERGEGVRDGGTIDDPRTSANEHAAGQSAGMLHDDNADHSVVSAAAVHYADTLATPAWVQAFPKLRVAQVSSVVAGKQPAAAVTAVPMRGRT
ncbi:transposase [Micromonospora sp. NPDC047187]|uniref:IS110 family transposase n=1 Tax=Micromonospora sp. NPDC047187 TaxID=3155262 RepID=UPI0033CC9FD4